MKKYFLALAFAMVASFGQAQEDLSSLEVEQLLDKRKHVTSFYIMVSVENVQNQKFSQRIQQLDMSPLPNVFLVNGFGLNMQTEKWTYLQAEFTFAGRRNFGERSDQRESYAYTMVRIGGGYNLLSSTIPFRLEPGLALLYGNGHYQLKSTSENGDFEDVLRTPQYNELNIRQNNFGLNAKISFSQNVFVTENPGALEFSTLEVGANVMMLNSAMRPSMGHSPDIDLTSFYLKLSINIISRR